MKPNQMKKNILFIVLSTLIISCGVKQTQGYLNSGNYDEAIANSINSLRSNKNAKGNQDYVYILEEAFAKAKERDQRYITDLSKDTNPSNLEKIYNTYLKLNSRQERIRPLLPLKLIKQGRDAQFYLEDYSTEILDSKNALSNFLYNNSKKLLTSKNKFDARKAFDDFTYLDRINPNFKDVDLLLNQAQFLGTDFVYVYTKNETNMVIPKRLQDDLLDFSTYGLNDKWTVYHNSKQKDIKYDYEMMINFRAINISPEQIKEKQFVREKQIKDGVKNLYDNNGNPVKDSLGNIIKVDSFKTVKVSIYEFSQIKSTQVTAKVDYLDLKSNQLIETFPITSEFVFTHVYATYNGDKRACEEDYYSFFDRIAVPFPSNEQMIFDTGENLKAKIKGVITRNKFRR